MTERDPRSRLFVALDLPGADAARRLIEKLGDAALCFKIGYRLAFSGGFAVGAELIAAGRTVFYDLKLHDIGNTVREGVESVAATGAAYLTVHAYPQTMRGAVAGRGSSRLKLLAVTALTSYDDGDLRDAGYALAVQDLVRLRAQQALTLGIDGIVCAASEAAIVRGVVGDALAIVAPGIRPSGDAAGDQKRTLTPGAAIRAGVDQLVVGRPITQAADPRAATLAILDEIAAAA
jgi:orotidine-5'-phosphate decarboxylase